MIGRLDDTYVAALQHDLAEISEDATRVGVVRRPTHWFHGAVDENVPALAPPAELLDEVKRRHEQLERTGLADEAAHNRALASSEYEKRYLAHLETPAAQAALEALTDRLEAGEDLALVCYENTEDKRCHRTLLRERIEARLAAENRA